MAVRAAFASSFYFKSIYVFFSFFFIILNLSYRFHPRTHGTARRGSNKIQWKCVLSTKYLNYSLITAQNMQI